MRTFLYRPSFILLLSFNISWYASRCPPQPGVKSSKKKLPRSMTVGALKTLIERLFRVKADRQLLQLKAGGAEVRAWAGGNRCLALVPGRIASIS